MNEVLRYRRLVRNAVLSFSGYAFPIIVALLCIPKIVRHLGVEQFGIFSLLMVIIGYANFFDLGLGRTLARMVAHRIGADRAEDVPKLIWTGLFLILLLGFVGLLVFESAVPLIVDGLNISDQYREDTARSFSLLAFSIPLMMFSTGFRGVLQAFHKFRFVSTVAAIAGSYNFLAPFVIVSYFNNLYPIVIALLCGRALMLLAYALHVFQVVPDLGRWRDARLHRTLVKSMIVFGGWMTVTNLIGPIFFYADRVLLGFKLSAEAVAYYSTPYDVVIRVLMIPSALIDVVFPEFSRYFGEGKSEIRPLFYKVSFHLFLIVAPICTVGFIFAHPLLEVWLGQDFADQGYRVIQILAVGIIFNSLARVSQALVQAAGHPDWSGKLQIAELVLYLIYLPMLIDQLGINGAAIAWLTRVTISFVALTYLASICLRKSGKLPNAE